MPEATLVVAIASPLEPELVDRIRAELPAVEVRFEPALLPPPRFPCDHRGDPSYTRSPEEERRFGELLAGADALFGVPGDSPEGLARVVRECPRLRWVAATAAGAGELVRKAELDPADLRRVTVTSAAGIHAEQLAEWAMFGVLAVAKDLPRLLRDKAARRWDHYPVRSLAGGTLLVVGLGGIGRAVAVRARAFGMRVIGVRRSARPGDADEAVDELHPTDALPELMGRADALVLSLPDTPGTHGLVGRELIDRLPRHAAVVNVGRGATLDEAALVDALREGRIAGAALDVTATEPLPPDSPLWELPNVLLSPHTAALSVQENARLVDLFIDNLRRLRAGRPLRNVVDVEQFY